MTSSKLGLVFGFLLLVSSACSGSKTAADAKEGAFNYAPSLDKPSHETMRRLEEIAIPGTPLRNAEEWTLDWDVVTKKDGDNYKRSLKLVGLKIDVNGQPLLKGDEVKAANATVDIITDQKSNVVDVHGADQLSQAIVGLGTPEAQPSLRRIFSPDKLRLLAAVRSVELHRDFVGHPAQVGSQWTADDGDGGKTQIRVVAEAPCGPGKCVQVVREYKVDEQALYAEISDLVAEYVKEQGGDPTKIGLVGMDVKLEDSLVIDPATMDYYGAKFDQQATIRVAGPNGELPVSMKVQRSTDFRY
ncbi:MAG TPA: hypothetical protein VMS65_08575 [Polyangiaceae bacterium]|nr:hypothetical protein [Polyangiaceae bacterium]